MTNGRFSDAQIIHCPAAHVYMCERGILKQAEGSVPVSELCREHRMSSASFYKWRAKFGGMDGSLIAEMKDMAEQNRRLKRLEKALRPSQRREPLGTLLSNALPASGWP